MALSFKKIIKSINGISTPIFGISWKPPESDCEIVRKLFLYLEDRRVLYYPYNMEMPYYVTESILNIRKYLTEQILGFEKESELLPNLKALRAACRKYLDEQDKSKKKRYRMMESEMLALGELRAAFGIHVAQLAVKYGVDIEENLEIILPLEDKD
jgi:hypothetical protein